MAVKSSTLRKEEYSAVANILLVSFERDLADFKAKYKTMNEEYLSAFKQSIEKVKNMPSNNVELMKQKELTKSLHNKLDTIKYSAQLLKDYAIRAKLDTSLFNNLFKNISIRNTEGVVKVIRDLLPYYRNNVDRLLDMPDGFLDKLKTNNDELEKTNTEQKYQVITKKTNTSDNKNLYKELYEYIRSISKAGKLIYIQNSIKKEEYTLSKLLAKLRTISKMEEDKTKKEDKVEENTTN
ncbi:MAG: hypothetical protein Q3983_04105 [Capnocytophaga sp.]|nr:hypothetical protein [Capnocytophaga sp.]